MYRSCLGMYQAQESDWGDLSAADVVLIFSGLATVGLVVGILGSLWDSRHQLREAVLPVTIMMGLPAIAIVAIVLLNDGLIFSFG